MNAFNLIIYLLSCNANDFLFSQEDTSLNINYLSFQERQQFHLEQLRAAEFRARAAAQQQLNAQQPQQVTSPQPPAATPSTPTQPPANTPVVAPTASQ